MTRTCPFSRDGIGTVADPAKAAIVRQHANGNETVPTVVAGDTGMVNPSAVELATHLATHAPHLLPADFELPQSGPIGKILGKFLG